MKNVFLILLALVLPLQASAAAGLGYMHALQGSQGQVLSSKHFVEHADHIAHHHDDDDVTHEDDSPASSQHLLDFDQSSGINALIPAPAQVSLVFVPQTMPMFKSGVLVTRTISPLLRPPHVPA